MLTAAEIYDPAFAVSSIAKLAFPARGKHKATLMADGRVLVSGGISANGEPLADMLLVDHATGRVEPLPINLSVGRYNHLSTLLPDHNVLITGGIGKNGTAATTAELYNASANTLASRDADSTQTLLAALNTSDAPLILDSQPLNGAVNVALGQILSVRFNKPLAMAGLNTKNVTLIGPDGQMPVTVTSAEGASFYLWLPNKIYGRGRIIPCSSAARWIAKASVAGYIPEFKPAPYRPRLPPMPT